jgi:hypothetical protein
VAGAIAGLLSNPWVSPGNLGTVPDPSSDAPLALTDEEIEGETS